MFSNSFSFKGRIRRKEYLISLIFQFAVLIHPYYFIYYLIKSKKLKFEVIKYSILKYIVSYILFCFWIITITRLYKENTTNDILENIIVSHYSIPAIILFSWFIFAQAAKRSHDIGNSGWYQLIPFYGLFLIFEKGQIGQNKYGCDPKNLESMQSNIEIINEIKTESTFVNYFEKTKLFINKRLNKISFKDLTSDEVIIISIIVGSIFCLIFGNQFGETQYYYDNGERTSSTNNYDYSKIDFNYIIAIISFIIAAGLSYIFLNRKSKITK